MVEARAYRLGFSGELVQQRLVIGETDLALCLPEGCWNQEIKQQLSTYLVNLRRQLQKYIADDPEFAATHRPYRPALSAPSVAHALAQAGWAAKTGPMAAVAGYFAAAAGNFLSVYAEELIVENGGDIYLRGKKPRIIGIYAGKTNPFSGRIGVKISPQQLPCGVCTSSGTIGQSFSYGVADAALVMAEDAALADAVATAAGNLVKGAEDVAAAAEYACSIPGIGGAVIICGEQLAVKGQIEIVSLNMKN